MKNPTARSVRCTIQRANGIFCDDPATGLVSYPVCADHAFKIYLDVKATIGHNLREGKTEDEWEADRREAFEARRANAVIYYVRIHDYIKIGTTIGIKQRLDGLRVSEDALLATEPGSYELEKKRHEQFKHLRIGKRENFRPTLELIRHIESVQDRNISR